MTGAQVREARRLLGWACTRLNAAADLPAGIVEAYEKNSRITPALTSAPTVDRLATMCAALEAAGIEFTNGNTPGVKLRKLK